MLLNFGAGEDSWESLGQQGDQISKSKRKSTLNIHWKDWCWSWSSNTLATWCIEQTHWKRPWCWERLKGGGEGGNRGWDGWMASSTQWTWIQANSRDSEGQGSLACCSPWAHKELDTTEWLKWTKNFPSRNSSIQSQCHLFPGLVPPPILVALWALYCAFIQAKDMFVESSEWLSKAPLTF